MILKFRAWDEKNEIITTDFTVGVENGILTFFSNDAEMRILKPLKCTNILDKNGKEIFDGDILHGSWFVTSDKREKSHIVKWENYGWDFGEFPSFVQIEIIGNIYENPELLK